MTRPLRFGVLGTAKIAREKVIPALQRGARTPVVALASRDRARAEQTAAALGVPRAHGSYEALLDDPDVDAVYIPLPNHLHVPWTIAAAERGKHVLCEKPIGLTAAEAETLFAVRDRTGVLIQEAFMVWTHPQWILARELIRSGRLGDVRAYTGHFSYFCDDPDDIVNLAAFGGGGLLDIGCYLTLTARLAFDDEPVRVLADIERDPVSGVDTFVAFQLAFPAGQAIGVCGTRMVRHQQVQIVGTRGRLDVEIPFSAPPDRPARLVIDDGRGPSGADVSVLEVPPCNQYTIQGDRFAEAAYDGAPCAFPLEESVRNMRVIDALFRSGAARAWETVSPR